ncbi:MAG: anhydro-N-acetylmuramic acid kinase [Pseudohongiellaceae bacterium]|nr:anhydro-N-acetylmuramic acid kinase [Pseudohongiellaceae bacterium]
MSSPNYFIGLMSGTSMDGIDCVLVDFASTRPTLVATHTEEIPAPLREQILQLCNAGSINLPQLGETDVALGRVFGHAVNSLLRKQQLAPEAITAIGSHGQTVWHQPTGKAPFSLQIADPNTIAEVTNISTVADFRRKDMAAGGQGAPLAPLFHQHYFSNSSHRRAVLNTGGIANITLLAHGEEFPIQGFDTGPANVLMDLWIAQHKKVGFDKDGQWARSGKLVPELLNSFLSEPYFQQTPPKSTGRELFNQQWLNKHLQPFSKLKAEDVQATLLELSARSIAQSVDWEAQQIAELIVCGGGAYNSALMERLEQLIPSCDIKSSAALGLKPEWVEGVAFAWFAAKTWNRETINTPPVTGARHPCLLGGIYYSENFASK